VEAIRYIVRGRVQGVGFRDFALRAARDAGVTGWVRNRDDGAVEAMAFGSTAELAVFAAALAEGPRRSLVERVEQEPLGEQPAPARFDITG
jgi:acylphosphatase